MKINDIKNLLSGPVLLAYDNFTPITRTPWAGKDIYNRYKKNLVGPIKDISIGESWEFSCDPDFPSKIHGYDFTLPELVDKFPKEVLGRKLAQTKTCEILVKLLNADSPLSLQVHPEDGDPSLAENECGKPESWFVLHTEKGCGLYLGFSKNVSKDELKDVLKKGDKAKDYFQFIEVSKGDFFEIAPGVPHAIGPGVSLLEPQRILFGKSGKTYRLWDWGRKYDDKGALNLKHGHPRELHIEEGLKLVRPDVQSGPEFINTLKKSPKTIRLDNGCKILSFAANKYYQVFIIKLIRGSSITLNINDGYGSLIILEGKTHAIGKSNSTVRILNGAPALLPNAAMPIKLSSSIYTELALTVPAINEENVIFSC